MALWFAFGNFSIEVTEGLFVGTTSSVVKFVGEFNRYFRCPSNSGKCKGKCVFGTKKGVYASIIYTQVSTSNNNVKLYS